MTAVHHPATAVLPDLPEEAFGRLLDTYLERGCSDFKIQLSGRLGPDRVKLFLLAVQARAHGVDHPRVCLDARNLWNGDVDHVIAHLRALEMPSVVIESPAPSDDEEILAEISRALPAAVIVPRRPLTGASNRPMAAVA